MSRRTSHRYPDVKPRMTIFAKNFCHSSTFGGAFVAAAGGTLVGFSMSGFFGGSIGSVPRGTSSNTLSGGRIKGSTSTDSTTTGSGSRLRIFSGFFGRPGPLFSGLWLSLIYSYLLHTVFCGRLFCLLCHAEK